MTRLWWHMQVVRNWADAVLAMVELMPSTEPQDGNIHFLSRKFFQGSLQVQVTESSNPMP